MDRIIELTESKEKQKCLICCESLATVKLRINRPKQEDSVTSFCVCDRCLAQMQKDIHNVLAQEAAGVIRAEQSESKISENKK